MGVKTAVLHIRFVVVPPVNVTRLPGGGGGGLYWNHCVHPVFLRPMGVKTAVLQCVHIKFIDIPPVSITRLGGGGLYFFTFTLLPGSSVLLQTPKCSEYHPSKQSPVVSTLSLTRLE